MFKKGESGEKGELMGTINGINFILSKVLPYLLILDASIAYVKKSRKKGGTV